MFARSVKPLRDVQRHAAASTQKAISIPMKQRAFSRSAGIEGREKICFMDLINEKVNSGKPRREGGALAVSFVREAAARINNIL
jgi:hypothetical protein